MSSSTEVGNHRRSSSEAAGVCMTTEEQSQHPSYAPFGDFAVGEIVTHRGVLYRVRADFTGYAGQTPGAYTPGEGYAWEDAWETL
jgi:hypothetical protein